MSLLVTAASGKTGRYVLSALLSHPNVPPLWALSRSYFEPPSGRRS
jgi:uncharacterized protein YbjT (DUF2867 family)